MQRRLLKTSFFCSRHLLLRHAVWGVGGWPAGRVLLSGQKPGWLGSQVLRQGDSTIFKFWPTRWNHFTASVQPWLRTDFPSTGLLIVIHSYTPTNENKHWEWINYKATRDSIDHSLCPSMRFTQLLQNQWDCIMFKPTNAGPRLHPTNENLPDHCVEPSTKENLSDQANGPAAALVAARYYNWPMKFCYF